MTYEQFLEDHRTKALQVITEQKARYSYAQHLFENYQIRMASLQLGPLTWLEIGDRLTDLDIAERDLDDDYADTEMNHARYEALSLTSESTEPFDEAMAAIDEAKNAFAVSPADSRGAAS